MDPTLRRRYDRVYRSLGRAELQRGAPPLEQLAPELLFERNVDMWMGYYTLDGLNTVVRSYGVEDRLNAMGFSSLRGQLLADGEEDMYRVWSIDPDLDDPLIEVVAKRGWIDLSGGLREELARDGLFAMSIEWLQLQNPSASFEPDKPRLPGQFYPGLGLAEEIFEMLRNACKRLRLNCLVNTPSYLHNALFYRNIGFKYLDPRVDGQVHTLNRALLGEGGALTGRFAPHQQLAAASWAVNWDLIVSREEGEEGKPFSWFHAPVIAPVAPWMRAALDGRWYLREAREEAARWSYEVDVDALARRLADEGILSA